MPWFKLNTGGTPTDPLAYTLEGTNPPSGCSGTDQICAVQATNNGSNEPVLSAALKDQMINALHTRAESTDVKLRFS